MTTSSSGAVFFLGTRAHYQVLQQPESRSYDVENGNVSSETIYQKSTSVSELWQNEQYNGQTTNVDNSAEYSQGNNHWPYYEHSDETGGEDKDKFDFGSGMKRRSNRRQSETTLCERDNDMRPAQLNKVDDCDRPKSKCVRRRVPLLSYLTSLGRRKRHLQSEQMQYLQHLQTAFNSCTYRESCRCLECQSRYFECEESSEEESFEESVVAEYSQYPQFSQYGYRAPRAGDQCCGDEYDDDEVFVDAVPEDNTSTDLLIEGKEEMSISSEELDDDAQDADLQLEVAAGTPVLLNYLLTHPITCSIQ